MFYDGCGHHASFSVPPVALRELEKPPPSLRDTTTDLEEIMGYGEEEDNSYPSETGVSSRRWEPDVRLSLFRADAFLGLFISFDVLKSRLKHPCKFRAVLVTLRKWYRELPLFRQLKSGTVILARFSKY